jgi:thiol:disulfide interchange protein
VRNVVNSIVLRADDGLGENMPENDLRFKAVVGILVVLCGLMFYRLHHPATTFAADGADPDWDAAAHYSHDAGQPTVVLFTAGWCPACRALHANVLSRSDVEQELQNHYSFYAVDLTNPSRGAQIHAQKCGVRYIPLLIRYDANGKETDRTNYMDADSLMAWLKAGE